MIWMDALEYGEDNNMSFLYGLNEKALVFDNMYTVLSVLQAKWE